MRITVLGSDPTCADEAGAPAVLALAAECDGALSIESARADHHPVAVYLARLAPRSRRTMRQALEVVAGIVGQGALTVEALPWSSLRYQHTAALRAAVAERFAPSTANKILSALRGVLRECFRLGILSAEDHAKAADVATVKAETLPRGRALSAGELRALFEACAAGPATTGVRDAALLAVLYGSGLRRSEVVALDVDDYSATSGELRVRSGKGRKDRLCHVPSGARVALERWLGVRGRDAGPLFVPVRKGGGIVVRRMTDQAVYSGLREIAARAGVQALSPHDLRRTFVGDLLDAGADISTVQALAGHANVTTTQRYDRRGEAVKKRAAELLHVPLVER